ncbi:uncharacterized protein [Eurosta solidaginis]|uniref:uncharacterized protein n=1 Tax=Eurosta solidaginis TaxID=178769 RepID=UPI003530B34A
MEMQPIKRERKRYQKDTAPTDDIITLINLVRENPTLYNYKLQPNQRRRIDVLNGWADIASQLKDKYTVEECRRKWKNLRDTYHQYRLRKPKIGDGLSKWRYAKELDFLSNVYQPKLKSQRHQNYILDTQRTTLHDLESARLRDSDHADNDMVHHHSSSPGITLVNDDETFILTTYEESVTDDVTTIDHSGEDGPSISADMELAHDDDDDVQEIVKNEHCSSLDVSGTEVHYEEVCMYEDAGNGPSVDCEQIIGNGGVVRSSSTDSKHYSTSHHHHTHSTADSFTYSMNDFCIESIPHLQAATGTGGGESGCGSSNSSVIGGTKLKNLGTSTIVTTPVVVSSSSNNQNLASQQQQQHNITSSILQLQSPNSIMYNGQAREELDLFFAFLKQKMQRFSKEEITLMQVEFLNCVQKREAERKYNGVDGGGDAAILS